MRRITTWVMSTISALVLLFSYHTSTNARAANIVATSVNSTAGSANAEGPTPTTTPSSGAASSGSASGSASTGASSSGSASSGSASSGSTAYAGSVIDTRYGPVQVQITVAGGRITKSVVLQVPWSDRRDQEINSQAVPILNAEAVQAQSAQIDMVSGASFTSDAYVQSLQSAIDQAHLA